MGKLFRQVLLLTNKNLKVRFSHKCLTFCELIVPLLITAVIGLLVSFANRSYSNHGYHSDELSTGSSSSSTKDGSPESKFDCGDRMQPYSCETRYDIFDKMDVKMEKLLATYKIQYLIADAVIRKPGGERVAEGIMENVLKARLSPNLTVSWERSTKTERDLEICHVQSLDFCKDIFAVIIITEVEDEVNEASRLHIKYKIRYMSTSSYGPDLEEYLTDRLFFDFGVAYIYHTLDQIEKIYLSPPTSWRSLPMGFVELQTFIDRGIMDYIRSKQSTDGRKRNQTEEAVRLSMVRMPYVTPSEDDTAKLSRFISLLYSLLGSLTIFSLMRVNSEKCSGFKELLRMHGVTIWTQWMGWLFSSFLVYSSWTLLMTMLVWLPLLGGANLLTVLNINPFLYWALLLLFTMSITAFCYFVSVFFEKVWTAASIGLVTWIVLTVMMMVTSAAFHTLKKWTVLSLMIIPTVSFDLSLRFFLNGGGRFRTLGVDVIENVPLTALHCLFMLLLDTCIFMALAVYLDNILPSKYGVRRSPLYVIRSFRKSLENMIHREGSSSYENPTCDDNLNQDSVEMTSIISQGTDSQQPFEPDPEHVDAAVVIRNLKKEYGKKRAVDGLTAKMFSGEIYTLLGFNGAGKTTTIGVLTGLSAPTDGLARIFDLDIRKDMEEIRRYIGLCPQHNLLYEEMNVLDQVAYFGTLKDIANPTAKATELLTWLGLKDKLYSRPEKLSGGQKRRVHLAIALIGDTKLAFLDEPTSGLDPETRRGVWDILLKLRGKMTVILTTHDMEEADILGDRIGIMSEGKMICSGTPSFLKKYYGVGYNLKMTAIRATCEPDVVHKFVRNYVPEAKLNFTGLASASTEEPRQQTDSNLSISLPTADLDLSRVADLMEALRQEKADLGVDNIGLSLSTMDEVFLKVGETVQAVTVTVPTEHNSANTLSSSRYVGSRLRWYRFMSLIAKRAAYFCHAPFTLIFLLIFFSMTLWLILSTLSFAVYSYTPSEPPRVVSSSSLKGYHAPVILLHENSVDETGTTSLNYTLSYLVQLKHSTTSYEDGVQVKEFPRNTSFSEITRYLKRASLHDLHHYRQSFVTGASFNRTGSFTNITGFFSAYAVHSAPLSMNMISQTRIKKSFGVDAAIGVTNHPFKKSAHLRYITPELITGESYYFVKGGAVILVVIIISLLTATAALLPTEERLNKGKQLQIMTGTSPFIYWGSMFAWDFCFFSVINGVITWVYYLAEAASGNYIYTNNGAGAIIFLILECHAFAALWFCYLVSWAPCIKTASDGFLIVNMFAVIVGILWNVIRHILIEVTVRERSAVFPIVIYYISELSGYVLWIVPMHSLFMALHKLASISMPNNICNFFPPDVLHLACDPAGQKERAETWFMHSCCENCQKNCFQPETYLNTSGMQLLRHYTTHSLVFDIMALILSGIFCIGTLFFLEHFLPRFRANQRLERTLNQSGVPHAGEGAEDEDVLNEGARVEDLTRDNALETANHALIAHKLRLNFGRVKAVRNLSFGVNRGECFGLLGVNGAGKTSTFRMITGDVFPTSGNMFSGGLNCYKHRDAYLSSFGYCPQFDGIIASLTGLQMVKLYGALRGIPPERLKEDATIWLDKFGLLGSGSKKCAAYSGGMRRRLSAAMALIGNPKLLLLDEPTTGVDPAFRRQFWNVIREIRESGQSVMLTSHTMDECEALCTRLGIMVDGKFKCLGNIRHLKGKFGKGYILTIKLRRVAEGEEREHENKVNQFEERIIENFVSCRVQTKQKVLLQYQILNKTLWYSDIFRAMERMRNTPEIGELIEEYSVTETSLEDVFISFANGSKKQENGTMRI